MQLNFEDKKKMLFESLTAAERNIQGTSLEQKNSNYQMSDQSQSRKRSRDDGNIEKYKNKDSLFKRPDLPINKCLKARQRPDYEKNPQRWQHYTLTDVSDSSDRMNTSAAFNFLREIEDRKQAEEMDADAQGSNDSKIVFKKSTKLKPRDNSTDEQDSQLNMKKIQNSKVVMPEYVVGQKKQKPRKDPNPRKSLQEKSTKESLKLSHLLLEEDEDS